MPHPYQILAKGLGKSFRVAKKKPGLKGSIQSFFHPESHAKEAVCPLDLAVRPGEIVGLLGPNGAGKTTLMKMLTGIIVPSQGELQVLGQVPAQRSRDFRKRISLVMGQKSQLWWDLPALDSFHLIRAYYEIEGLAFHRRLDELSQLLQVQGVLEIPLRKLSLGERMKVELMASLLHEPEVLFLDEPTIGLDLIAQKNIRDFLLQYHARKQPTLILTSHYMADIEALCERVVLLIEGKKRFDGSISRFEGLLGHNKIVRFSFRSPVAERDFFAPFQPTWDAEGNWVELNLAEADLSSITVEILSRFPVSDFATAQTPVERVLERLLQQPQLLAPEG